MTVLVRHIIVIWDECEHVSAKHLKNLANIFLKNYVAEFPEGAETQESPMILSTRSQIVNPQQISSFLHNGQFIPHSGPNKDLALVKYCATGLVDQDERYRFLVDDLRNMRHFRGEPPIMASESTIVIFVTTDWATGMLAAIETVQGNRNSLRTNFITLRAPKKPGAGQHRMAFVGAIVGKETKKRFIRHEHGSLLLNLGH